MKWKKFVSRNEIRNIEVNLNKFKKCRKILIVPEIDILEVEPEGIEVWDTERVLEMARKSLGNENI